MMVLTDEEREALRLPPPPKPSAGIPPLERVLPAHLSDLAVSIRVELGTIRAAEGTWEQLRVGDRLPIPSLTQGFPILADNYLMGTGAIRRVGNHLAVQIQQWGPDQVMERS